MIFDTHTHIYLPEFDADRADVVQRARENGVTRLMLPNVDLDTVDALHQTLREYPDMCIAAMGLHPTSVTGHYAVDLERIAALLEEGSYHAVGEIGIDLYWDRTFENGQIIVFEEQVRLAARLGHPIIIHCREAFEPIATVLRRLSHLGLRGVFHSFSGDAECLSTALSLGDFYFGINGTVTFKKNRLRELLPAIPADRLLLETDAPYLAPVPYRGKRNEPSFLKQTAAFVAAELHRDTAEIEAQTYENACRLFDIDRA